MNSESEELLKNTLTLARENNKMLHKIRRVQKRETFWHVLKLIIIIGIALGSFYFIEPYLNKIVNLYNSVFSMQQNIKNVTDISNNSFKNLLEKF